MQQRSVQVVLLHFSLFLNLFAKQKIPDDRMLKGWNWKQSTTACSDPINDNVFNVGISWASPFKAGAQNRIEISAGIIECFKIEKWNEYNDQPGDVMMPEQYQTFKFFTGNDKRCSNETV